MDVDSDVVELPQTQPIFRPTAAEIAGSQLTTFRHYCETTRAVLPGTYGAFDSFAVREFRTFWALFLRWSELPFEGEIDPVCVGDDIEHARFFPALRLNYAECLLDGEPDRPAATACHADGRRDRLTRGELRSRLLSLAEALDRMGVRSGDHVAAIARNNVEVVIVALAAAAIGAVFCSCSPDMGAEAILARLSPLKPVVLFGTMRAQPWDFGKPVATRLAEVVGRLPSLRALVTIDDDPAMPLPPGSVHRFADLTARAPDAALCWKRHPFNHPLFVLFSSGTTGSPKCIVHGAGGTLLEHVKEHRLHCDLGSGDKLFFHTSCSWMMWNWQLSALASGAEIVLYDGPIEGPETLWRLVENEGVTVFGTSAGYLQFSEAAGISPGRMFGLRALRSILSTGSILYPRQYFWAREHVKAVPLQSISGGTDIIGCFVLGNPNLPVYPGAAQCRSLGLDVQALPAADAESRVGELICANPFPSRPLGLHGDADGSRFHQAYFSQNPGVWTHGDLIEFAPGRGWQLHGRSDGVINVRGIRVGPAEIYSILQSVDEIAEAMAVEQEVDDEPGRARLVLLVVLRRGAELDGELARRIRSELAARGSPGLIPARIAQVDALPITYSGKASETAARDALNRRPVRNREALRNPDCLDALARHPALQVSSERSEPQHDAIDLHDGDKLERELQRVCESFLGVSPIARSDNFLALGGDSLTMLNLFLEVQQLTGRNDLSLAALFSAPTIDRLARLLRSSGARAEASNPAGPHIRPADALDVEPLRRFLDEGFREHGVPAAAWRRLFDYAWISVKPDLGFVLTEGDEIVGFLGTIYAERHTASQTGLVCNLTSWYVRPEYRGWGTALLAAAIHARALTYTTFTPGPLSRQVLKGMQFMKLDRSRIFMPPLLHADTLRGPRPLLSFDPDTVRDLLDAAQRKIFDDHAPYDCLQLVLSAGSQHAYMVVKRRFVSLRRLHRRVPTAARLPYSEILYCTQPGLLGRHIERVKLAVLRRQKTLALVADERLFGDMRPRGFRKTDHACYRSPHLAPGEVDKLYSEFVLLPI